VTPVEQKFLGRAHTSQNRSASRGAERPARPIRYTGIVGHPQPSGALSPSIFLIPSRDSGPDLLGFCSLGWQTEISGTTMAEQTYYRIMRSSPDGAPLCGASATRLGVRDKDVVIDSAGFVQPKTGGMSVTPDDPRHLPEEFRPESSKEGSSAQSSP